MKRWLPAAVAVAALAAVAIGRTSAEDDAAKGGALEGLASKVNEIVLPNGLRVLAAAIDLAIIGGIDLAVVYFTLRVSGRTWADASGLPIVPLAAFFLLLNGGYATIFTAAAGQTIGKMLAGIRVVPAAAEAETPRLAVSTALVREAACLLFHNTTDGRDLVAKLARRGRGLPARVIPIEVLHVAALGTDLLLGALALGAAQVVILSAGSEAEEYAAALTRELAYANTIVAALG